MKSFKYYVNVIVEVCVYPGLPKQTVNFSFSLNYTMRSPCHPTVWLALPFVCPWTGISVWGLQRERLHLGKLGDPSSLTAASHESVFSKHFRLRSECDCLRVRPLTVRCSSLEKPKVPSWMRKGYGIRPCRSGRDWQGGGLQWPFPASLPAA